MNVPELIDGGIQKQMEEQRDISEMIIRSFIPPPTTKPMTLACWAIVIEGFRHGCRCQLTLLQFKSDYLVRNPVMIGGLAVADESRARECGRRARMSFKLDPRQEVHDPRTWRLMKPGCLFSIDLDKFVDEGIPRGGLSITFRCEVAIFFDTSMPWRLQSNRSTRREL